MNIFFLSWDVVECAHMYCDQHVVKILLEIVQMLYTAWWTTGGDAWNETAPFKKNSGQRGYLPVSNPKHGMVLWVRASKENYMWTALMGISLSIEFNKRFGKIHGCTEHALWLYQNPPTWFRDDRNEKAFYATVGFPSRLTPPPEAMPDQYKDTDIIKAYMNYYKGDKLSWARWSNPSCVPRVFVKDYLGRI